MKIIIVTLICCQVANKTINNLPTRAHASHKIKHLSLPIGKSALQFYFPVAIFNQAKVQSTADHACPLGK